MIQANGDPTSLTAYEVPAGLFARGLANLKRMLTKAEAYVAASGSGDAALIDAQLAADMNNLGVQIHAVGRHISAVASFSLNSRSQPSSFI